MVLSCAGAYVSGAAGSNECPPGSVRIVDKAACRTAAAAAGKTDDVFDLINVRSPRGCYYDTSDNNAHFSLDALPFDTPFSRFQLLCAALATTGAPLTRRYGTRERACTRGRCV